MMNHSDRNIEIEWMDSFLKRLTGAITRPLNKQRKLLVFSPGGSVHTFFMRYKIHVFFLDQDFNILQVHTDINPWKVVLAPKGTRYVAESGANITWEDARLAVENLNG